MDSLRSPHSLALGVTGVSDNIINFPTKDPDDWPSISKTIKSTLIESGLSELQTNEFVSIFEPIYKSFKFDYSFNLSVPDEATAESIKSEMLAFQTSLQQHNLKLISERLTREIKFYRYQL